MPSFVPQFIEPPTFDNLKFIPPHTRVVEVGMCTSCGVEPGIKGSELCLKCLIPKCSRCGKDKTDLAYKMCTRCREVGRIRRREGYWKEKAKLKEAATKNNNTSPEKDVVSLSGSASPPVVLVSPTPPPPISFDGLSSIISTFLGWLPGIFFDRSSWDGVERSVDVKIQGRTARVSISFI